MLRLAFGTALIALAAGDPCVAPGICTPPATNYKAVLPMNPRRQWTNSGGFCGSASVQMNSLMFGNYFSQDQVRKATTHGEGHGNKQNGFEILPTNIEEAMDNLALTFNSWDYNSPKPQGPAYKRFLKKSLVNGHPVVWFVMCRGDGSQIPYPGSNPNDGRFSHIEPVWGFFTNHSLTDDEVREDDWLVHGSDWDNNGYHRQFSTLIDAPSMNGNCRHAGSYPGTNEAYPCIYNEVDYGYAITGNVDPKKRLLPAILSVDNNSEPNVSTGQRPNSVKGTLTISSLTAGRNYVIFRFDNKQSVPRDSNYESARYAQKYPFTARSNTYVFEDPNTFMSNEAIFYRVVESN